ncbi:MAG TPA: hypothetical protein VE133_18135, partial [Candidatus Sulfotelmatobacter sp.]|nr:hypothetical protein [Candidatus Sulfotelmatobacter sp.]
KGLAIALIHIVIVLSLGAKLLYDRGHRPRIWVRTGSIDPDLPIRGRYFTLNLQVHSSDFVRDPQNPRILKSTQPYGPGYVELAIENGQLVAHKADHPTGMTINSWAQPRNPNGDIFLLSSPVVFFIPEHAEGPQLNRRTGDELWAEVTIPRKGPPRPIQLALKRSGEWVPLTYK